MPRIRMMESLATTGGNMHRGQEYDVDVREAGRLIAGGVAVAVVDVDKTPPTPAAPVPSTDAPPGPNPATTTPEAKTSVAAEDVVPPVDLPRSTDSPPFAGGKLPLEHPLETTTLPSSLDADGVAERERQAALDADPIMFGHKLSYFDGKSDPELIDLPNIGKKAVEKIREAQRIRDDRVAAAKAAAPAHVPTPEQVAAAASN